MAKSKSTNGNGKPNRSAAIREELAATPHASSKDIVAILAAKGLKVTLSLVYMVKSQLKLKKKRQKRELATATSKSTASLDPVQLIVRVKELARDAGGIKQLKQLVDVLAE